MKYTKKCECCGHLVAAYSLPLNEAMVRAFLKLAGLYIPQKAHLGNREGAGFMKGELGLSNSQYGNFQNLRHFGLIYQIKRAGPWHLTELGMNFYLGTAAILVPAGHMGGETLPPDHPAWATHKGGRRRVSIRDVLPEEFKQRIEFQAEKSGQGRLVFA